MNAVLDAARYGGGDLRGLRPVDGQTPLDVGTCVNTYGPHPEVLRALAAVTADEMRTHPYTAAADVADAYVAHLAIPGVEVCDVLVGAGITAFLQIIERMAVPTATIWPDYTETIRRFDLADGGLDSWQQRARRLDAALATYPMVVISSPQNPGGAVIPAAELLRVAADHPRSTLVVDEAYAEFLPGPPGRGVLGCDAPNVAVLRSPNKMILGAAGIRVGMLWTRQPALRAHVAAELPRWPIGQADAAAACAGLRSPHWVDNTRRALLTTAGQLDTALRDRFGDQVLRSPLHFRFVYEPDPQRLDQVWTHFERQGIAVRVFTADQPGRLPGLRFVAPTAVDWPRLQHAIDTVPRS